MAPKLARAIFSLVVPRDARDGILRDLDEVFERKRAVGGEAAARRWYRREVLSFAWRFATVPSGVFAESLNKVGVRPAVAKARRTRRWCDTKSLT